MQYEIRYRLVADGQETIYDCVYREKYEDAIDVQNYLNGSRAEVEGITYDVFVDDVVWSKSP